MLSLLLADIHCALEGEKDSFTLEFLTKHFSINRYFTFGSIDSKGMKCFPGSREKLEYSCKDKNESDMAKKKKVKFRNEEMGVCPGNVGGNSI